MAQFIKAWDGSYINIAQVRQAVVRKWVPSTEDPDPSVPADGLYWIWCDGQAVKGQGPLPQVGWATAAAAQAVLDTAITNLGGSV